MIITDLSAYMNMWNVHTCISGYKIRGVGVCDFFQLIKILLSESAIYCFSNYLICQKSQEVNKSMQMLSRDPNR